jgi:hypothetical protein
MYVIVEPRLIILQLCLALILPASGGRLVGIVRLRTKAKEFSYIFFGKLLYVPRKVSIFTKYALFNDH